MKADLYEELSNGIIDEQALAEVLTDVVIGDLDSAQLRLLLAKDILSDFLDGSCSHQFANKLVFKVIADYPEQLFSGTVSHILANLTFESDFNGELERWGITASEIAERIIHSKGGNTYQWEYQLLKDISERNGDFIIGDTVTEDDAFKFWWSQIIATDLIIVDKELVEPLLNKIESDSDYLEQFLLEEFNNIPADRVALLTERLYLAQTLVFKFKYGEDGITQANCW